MISVIQGNILDIKDSRQHAIVHGCNCHNIMGAGLAKQIANKYPQAFEADRIWRLNNSTDIDMLGGFSSAKIDNKFIINAYTQYDLGANAEYAAISSSLRELAKAQLGIEHYYIPKIGCGIGGLQRKLVERIINQIFNKNNCTIVDLGK